MTLKTINYIVLFIIISAIFLLSFSNCSATYASDYAYSSNAVGYTLINSGNIPDPNFRNFLINSMALVTLEDCSRIKSFAAINQGIADITGIKNFTALTTLSFSNNLIPKAPGIPDEFNQTNLPNLKVIDLRNNSLTLTDKNKVLANFPSANVFLDP
jgi:Leucine-rich repeat (LRR) protein